MSYEIYPDDLFVDVTPESLNKYSKMLGKFELTEPIFRLTLSRKGFETCIGQRVSRAAWRPDNGRHERLETADRKLLFSTII